jgi:2-hydroxychromene-2-carboxylate isomerase
MPAPIEFYFDFSSPYAYLASERIEALAARHGREVKFKPILLGAVFKATGGAPLTEGMTVKGTYSVHDFGRSARYEGIPYAMPNPFPIATVTAARAMLWLAREQPARAAPFMHAAFRAYFADGRDISQPAVVGEVLRECGVDAERALAGAGEQDIKDQLKAQVEGAIVRGVFGAPTIFVDGEMFWGNDRLPQIDRWLASGGF